MAEKKHSITVELSEYELKPFCFMLIGALIQLKASLDLYPEQSEMANATIQTAKKLYDEIYKISDLNLQKELDDFYAAVEQSIPKYTAAGMEAMMPMANEVGENLQGIKDAGQSANDILQ